MSQRELLSLGVRGVNVDELEARQTRGRPNTHLNSTTSQKDTEDGGDIADISAIPPAEQSVIEENSTNSSSNTRTSEDDFTDPSYVESQLEDIKRGIDWFENDFIKVKDWQSKLYPVHKQLSVKISSFLKKLSLVDLDEESVTSANKMQAELNEVLKSLSQQFTEENDQAEISAATRTSHMDNSDENPAEKTIRPGNDDPEIIEAHDSVFENEDTNMKSPNRRIQRLENQIKSLTSIPAKVKAVESSVKLLQASQTAMSIRIDNVEKQISDVKTDQEELRSYVSKEVTCQLDSSKQVESEVSAIQTRISAIKSLVDNIKDNVRGNKKKITDVSNQCSEILSKSMSQLNVSAGQQPLVHRAISETTLEILQDSINELIAKITAITSPEIE